MAQKVIREQYADGTVVLSNIRNNKGIPFFNQNDTITATKVSQWYDGSPMTPDKSDGKVYLRYKPTGEYFLANLPNWGDTFLEKDTMAQMRALSSTEILLLKMGYYKGVSLNGYYAKGDTPTPVKYFLSNTSEEDDGGAIIEASNIKLEHKFYGYINVKYFGAKGNFNSFEQIGQDDTIPFQNALNHLKSFTDIRRGEGRCLFIPVGGYLLSNIIIDGIGIDGEGHFGLDILGESESGTMLFFDNSNSNIGIDNREEAVSFRNISLNGSRFYPSEVSQRVPVLIKSKKWSGHADIDISFKNCAISNFSTFVEIYGRGIIFDNCALGLGVTLVDIVCNNDVSWDDTDPWGIHSKYTGMRHYIVRNSRVDGVSIIVSVSGEGEQKDYIHGIVISNNNGTGPDRVINSLDCSLRNPQLLNNDFRESCRFGAVTVPKVYEGVDMGNSWKSSYNPNIPITTDQQSILGVWICDYIYGLKFSSSALGIRHSVIRANIQGRDIKVVNSEFDRFLDYKGGSTEGYVVYSPSSILGLEITNNIFRSNSSTGFYLYNRSAQNIDGKTIVNGNISNFEWSADVRQLFTPKVYVNNVVSSGNFQSSAGVYFDETFVYVDFALSGSFGVGEIGDITLELPNIAAIPMSGAISSFYSGSGKVNWYNGFKDNTNKSMDSVLVSASDQKLLFKTNHNNMNQYNLSVDDVNGNISMFGEFKYRYR